MKTKSIVAKRAKPGAIGAFLIASALAAGCVSVPAPKEQLAVAQSAVNDAIRSGAPKYAPAELKTAQDKLERAHELTSDREHKEALRLAEEAELDARLAEAKAAAGKTQEAADQVQQSLDVLRQELNLNNQSGSNQGG